MSYTDEYFARTEREVKRSEMSGSNEEQEGAEAEASGDEPSCGADPEGEALQKKVDGAVEKNLFRKGELKVKFAKTPFFDGRMP